MADSEVITIPLCLPLPEAMALASLVKRLDRADCARLASPDVAYGDRPESDVMWSGLLTLQGALAGAGYVAR